jgi:hypothetical protein
MAARLLEGGDGSFLAYYAKFLDNTAAKQYSL